MLKTITAAALMLGVATNAHALGDSERDALAALGGIFIIEKIVENSDRDRDRRYRGPVTSQEERAYRRGVLDRERQEAARREREAYECGYYGDCR